MDSKPLKRTADSTLNASGPTQTVKRPRIHDVIDLTVDDDSNKNSSRPIRPSIYIKNDPMPPSETRPQVGDASIHAFVDFVSLVAPVKLPSHARGWQQQNTGMRLQTWLQSLDKTLLRRTLGAGSTGGFRDVDWTALEWFASNLCPPTSRAAAYGSNNEFLIRSLIAELVLEFGQDFSLWSLERIPSQLHQTLNLWDLQRLSTLQRMTLPRKILQLQSLPFFDNIVQRSNSSETSSGGRLARLALDLFETFRSRLVAMSLDLRHRPFSTACSSLITHLSSVYQRSLVDMIKEFVKTSSAASVQGFAQHQPYMQLVLLQQFLQGNTQARAPQLVSHQPPADLASNGVTAATGLDPSHLLHATIPHVGRPHSVSIGRSVALPPGADDEFEKFLEELQADSNLDPNEGTNTAKEVAQAASEIHATLVAHDRYSLPGLSCELHPHQVIGVAWMVKREKQMAEDGKRSKVRGGVLADAMGLGKTVQTLGLLVNRKPENSGSLFDRLMKISKTTTKEPTTTLIICPVALIRQWEREIHSKAPGCFDIRIHHGATKLKTILEIKSCDIIITSYGTLARDYPIKKHHKVLTQDEKDRDLERIERDKGVMFRVKFFRIILDEAHIIKSPGANVSVAACNLDSVTQWCLTGTPLLNQVDDIFPLLRVLKVPFFRDRTAFRKEITKDSQGAKKLREILAPFLKRRTKDDKIAGKAVLVLPEKHVVWLDLTLDEDESKLYKQVQDSMVSELNKFLADGVAVKKVSHIFSMILRLRQLCIHPFLILEHLASKSEFDSTKLMQNGNGLQAISDLLETTGMSFGHVNICGLCEVEAEDPVLADICKHCFCRKCISGRLDDEQTTCPVCGQSIRSVAVMNGNSNVAAPITDFSMTSGTSKSTPTKTCTTPVDTIDSAIRAKADSGTPEGSNFDHSLNSAWPKLEPDSAYDDLNIKGHEFGAKTNPVLLESDDESLPELSLQLALQNQPTEIVMSSSQQRKIDPGSSSNNSAHKFESPSSLSVRRKYASSPSARCASSPRFQAACKAEVLSRTPANSAGLGDAPLQPYTVDCADMVETLPGPSIEERRAEAKSWKEILKMKMIPSTKLTAVEKKLEEWMSGDNSKLIIFSQFVKALDLVDKICRAHDWPVLRYQGNMNMKERESTIMEFEEIDGPRILLMSLKAGGVGLNLTCANKVMMLDFWWNAAAEFQAIDRCHRMGQLKEVTVVRTYLPGTVEERIKNLQDEKLRTAGQVLGETETGGKMARLGMRELMGLFGRVTTNADGIQQIETR